MTDENKTFQPTELDTGANGTPPATPEAPQEEQVVPDIQITPATPEPLATPELPATPETPATPEPLPPSPEALPADIQIAPDQISPVAEPEIKAPEIVKPPVTGEIADELKPSNGEESFFKKNKTMIIGAVVVLIVVTVIVGILLSIKNSDKLEGKLRLLESQQINTTSSSNIVIEQPVIEAPVIEAPVAEAVTVDEAKPKPMPNITPIYQSK